VIVFLDEIDKDSKKLRALMKADARDWARRNRAEELRKEPRSSHGKSNRLERTPALDARPHRGKEKHRLGNTVGRARTSGAHLGDL
jgi:hypothetical protein